MLPPLPFVVGRTGQRRPPLPPGPSSCQTGSARTEIVRRRDILHVAGAVARTAASSTSGLAHSVATGPSPSDVLRRDLEGQRQVVEKALAHAVTLRPGEVSVSIGVGDTGPVPGAVAHTVSNESGQVARIQVIYG
jgi:hypothetical protein